MAPDILESYCAHAEGQTSSNCKSLQCDVHTAVTFKATATPLVSPAPHGVESARAVIIRNIIVRLQAERHALRKDVTRAQTQLLEAQTSSRAAEAAASTSHEEKVVMAETLSLARFASSCAYTRRPLRGNASTRCASHQRLTPCYVFVFVFKCEHEADLNRMVTPICCTGTQLCSFAAVLSVQERLLPIFALPAAAPG